MPVILTINLWLVGYTQTAEKNLKRCQRLRTFQNDVKKRNSCVRNNGL